MRCRNCGCELLPDSAFCPQCGASVEQQYHADEQVQHGAGVEQQYHAGEQVQYGAGGGQQYNLDAQQYSTEMQQMNAVGKKRSKKLPVFLLAGLCFIILLAAAGVTAVKMLGGSGSRDYQVAYYKDGKIYYTPNVKKDKDAYEVTEVRIEDESDHPGLQMTADGSYLYFYSRVDYENGSDLCRIPVSEIGQDEEKNEDAIEDIEDGVAVYTVLDGDTLVYRRNSGDLIYLCGEGETKIDSDVDYFNVYQEEQIISYSKVMDEDRFDYYLFDIESKDSERVGRDLTSTDAVSKDFILYERLEGDSITLYTNSLGGKEEKVADDIFEVCSSDSETKNVYYITKRTEERALYDFVDDTYADSDAGITEPDRKNFLSETTERNAVSEDDYEYYFEEGAEGRTRFYSYLDFDSDMNMYYYYNDDYYYDDENYLFYYDDLSNKWYSYDMQSYEEAAERYDNLADRIELRQELKENTYNEEIYDLYYYEQGTLPVLIAENVGEAVLANAANQFSMYRKLQGSSIKIPMDNIYDADDVLDILSGDDYEKEEAETPGEAVTTEDIYYAVGADEQKYKGSEFPYGIDFSEDGSHAVISFSYDADRLEMCSLEGEVLKGEELSDNARSANVFVDGASGGGWVGNAYYYFERTGSEGKGADLFRYKDGESERIARNVSQVSLMKDGNQLIYKDSPAAGDGYEAGMLELHDSKGDSIKISSKAMRYGEAYLEEDCILYISNESLYVYTGDDEDRRVDRNITNYRCMGDLEAYIYY